MFGLLALLVLEHFLKRWRGSQESRRWGVGGRQRQRCCSLLALSIAAERHINRGAGRAGLDVGRGSRKGGSRLCGLWARRVLGGGGCLLLSAVEVLVSLRSSREKMGGGDLLSAHVSQHIFSTRPVLRRRVVLPSLCTF